LAKLLICACVPFVSSHATTNSPPSLAHIHHQTFRTSSPAAGGGGGIYAQPKLVNSMSSFRTSSPSPNGHAHPLPPTQPKTNPNLIAQLNARLSGKQQQPHQQQQQNHYLQQQQQHQPAQQPPVYQAPPPVDAVSDQP